MHTKFLFQDVAHGKKIEDLNEHQKGLVKEALLEFSKLSIHNFNRLANPKTDKKWVKLCHG